MTWIKTIPPEQATGALKTEYELAVQRAGRVFNILAAQSLNPEVLHASVALYKSIMVGPSSLSQIEREMIAVVVSKTLGCVY